MSKMILLAIFWFLFTVGGIIILFIVLNLLVGAGWIVLAEGINPYIFYTLTMVPLILGLAYIIGEYKR